MNTAKKIVVLGDMRDIHHHGCEAVMAQVQRGLTRVGLPPQLILPGLDWKAAGSACREADLVVINGEGALHHSRPSVSGVLELAEQRRKDGRPTALINSSWFHNDEDLTKRLGAFDLVALRESQSHVTVAAAGVNCRMVPDLAISEAFDSQSKWGGVERSGFMVSDSTRPEVTWKLEFFADRRGWDYLPVLARPVELRPSAKSHRIHQRVRLVDRFGPFARIFLSARYRAHCAGVASVDEYCGALARVSGVLTGRFHTACFALGLEVPMLIVASNTPKIESVLTDAGLDLSRRIVKLPELKHIVEVPPFSDAELSSLQKFLETTRAAHQELFSALQQLATKGS